MSAQKPVLLAMGNPLLDMQVRDDGTLLKKYSLNANDAILVGEKQAGIYDDLKDNHQLTYVAGGAAQNAARGAQYILPPNSTAYLGCVGSDAFADQLRAANEKEGLKALYQVLPKGADQTGTCAVVITNHDRSLCTLLGAAEKFSPSHLDTPEVVEHINAAKFYYLGGFFLTHGIESSLKLAKKSVEQNKTFTMNLSAPFISQFFKAQVDEIMPYVDVLFGNESEAEAYAAAHGWETKDVSEIATKIAQSTKVTGTPRTVVITQGAESTVVAQGSAAAVVYPVPKLDSSAIVDTNGAGDAFAGGFLGALVLGKPVPEAVDIGHKMGQMCIGEVGPAFKFPKVQIV